MNYEKTKEKILKSFKKEQLIEAVKVAGAGEKLVEGMSKKDLVEILNSIDGLPHIVTQEDVDGNLDVSEDNGEPMPFVVGEMIWLPKFESEPGDDDGDDDDDESEMTLCLANVRHNGVLYEKGMKYNLSTEEAELLKGLGAI